MNFKLFFRSRKGEMLNLLKNLVELESPSDNKIAVDKCSSYIVKEFKKIGCLSKSIKQEDVGDFQVIEYPAVAAAKENNPILILTHIDTVWPVGRIARRPFYILGDKVFGPGALDMKAGLVMAFYSLAALNSLNLKPARKIIVFINSAEEIGHEQAHIQIQKLARKVALALCLEPALPGGALKLERKGRLVIRVNVSGKKAHAGTPEKGVNAIEELAVQIQKLKKLHKHGVTVSPGLISGGEKANIVPEAASAVFDIRFWTSLDKNKIVAAARSLNPSLKGAKIKATIESLTPPMELTKASQELYEKARTIASSRLGQELKAGKSGGGSDASIVASLGVPTLDGLGPDGNGMHAENEHLLISSLIDRTALLTELLINL